MTNDGQGPRLTCTGKGQCSPGKEACAECVVTIEYIRMHQIIHKGGRPRRPVLRELGLLMALANDHLTADSVVIQRRQQENLRQADLLSRVRRETIGWQDRAQVSEERWREQGKLQGDPWHWDATGDNHLESLTCPVLISANDLRELLKKD